MIGVNLKDRKSTNWIREQSGVTDIVRNIEKANTDGWTMWQGEVTIDGQSEPQNGYPVIPHGHKRPQGRLRTR